MNRLAGWGTLVGVLASVNYAARFSGESNPKDVLYRYETAVASAVFFAVMLAIVLFLARFDRSALALRRPRSWAGSFGLMLAVLCVVYVLGGLLSPFLDPGKEQGLTPDRWESARALPFFANAVVVVLVAPITEELTFRGLGFSLLRRFGESWAIGVTALAFALGHGLVEGLPVLFALGVGLAYIRARQESVVPGMILHGSFNAIALAVSVTT